MSSIIDFVRLVCHVYLCMHSLVFEECIGYLYISGLSIQFSTAEQLFQVTRTICTNRRWCLSFKKEFIEAFDKGERAVKRIFSRRLSHPERTVGTALGILHRDFGMLKNLEKWNEARWMQWALELNATGCEWQLDIVFQQDPWMWRTSKQENVI